MHRWLAAALLTLQVLSACAHAQSCELSNEALRAMPSGSVTLADDNGSQRTFSALIANDNYTRSEGFQRICAEAIATSPILFVFEQPVLPRFHMHNVVAPIDIAFITAAGVIESIQAMQPYVMGSRKQRLYSPAQPIQFALEAAPGFFSAHQIHVGDRMTWQFSVIPSD